MGMYDTVLVKCPECGIPAEFQSKSGSCKLETYILEETPDDVLLDVNRHAPVTCVKCGARFGVEIEGTCPQRTRLARSKIWKDADEVDQTCRVGPPSDDEHALAGREFVQKLDDLLVAGMLLSRAEHPNIFRDRDRLVSTLRDLLKDHAYVAARHELARIRERIKKEI